MLGVKRWLGGAIHLLGGIRVVVAGRSMEPALQAGDRLLVSRIAYRTGRPRRGDIVFLRPTPAAGRAVPECIKRVVGLPHERVVVRGRAIWISGRQLSEPYLTTECASMPPLGEDREWTLDADRYFVLGDNRAASTDSREFGPVRRSEIVGLVWYRYAPRERAGRL